MEKRIIIGGIFATKTVVDEQGNVVQQDEFHTRLYWDLWLTGAIKKLKGAKLFVLLTIAQHLDKNAKGFPSIRRMEQLLPYNRDAITKAIKELEELGFIEREQQRGEEGEFGNMVYRLRLGVETPENQESAPCLENTDTDENAGKSRVSTVSGKHGYGKKPSRKNTATEKPKHKEEPSSFKKEPSFKERFDDDSSANSSKRLKENQLSEGKSLENTLVGENLKPEKPWETDYKYQAYRSLFTEAGADDIKDHQTHYPRFLEAINQAGGMGKLLGYAESYLQEVKQGEHEHTFPQIAWFLKDSWKAYATSPSSKPKKEKKNVGEKLPKSVTSKPKQRDLTPEEKAVLAEKQARIQAKLQGMNQAFQKKEPVE